MDFNPSNHASTACAMLMSRCPTVNKIAAMHPEREAQSSEAYESELLIISPMPYESCPFAWRAEVPVL